MPVPTLPNTREMSLVSGGTETYETEIADVPTFYIGAACTIAGYSSLRVTDVKTSQTGASPTRVTTVVTYSPGAAGTSGGGGVIAPWDLPPDVSVDDELYEVESAKDARGKTYKNSAGQAPFVKPKKELRLSLITITRNVNSDIHAGFARGATYSNKTNSAAITVIGYSFPIGTLLCRYKASQKYLGNDAYIQEEIKLTYNPKTWKQLVLDEGVMYLGKVPDAAKLMRMPARGVDGKPIGFTSIGGVLKATSGARYREVPFRLNGKGRPIIGEDPDSSSSWPSQQVAYNSGDVVDYVDVAESSASQVFLKFWDHEEVDFTGLDLP